MAKRFMFVCLGILALAVAYHLGASSAHSQLQGQAVSLAAGGYTEDNLYALTSEGDFYVRGTHGAWYHAANIFGTVATEPSTLGDIKARFAE